jgi:hypothetical protein
VATGRRGADRLDPNPHAPRAEHAAVTPAGYTGGRRSTLSVPLDSRRVPASRLAAVDDPARSGSGAGALMRVTGTPIAASEVSCRRKEPRMNRAAAICMLCIVACLPPAAFAQGSGGADPTVRRNESGSINWAPLPATYTVVAVNSHRRTVTVRDRDGAVAEVRVEPHIFDLDRIAPGDPITIDFYEPDGRHDGLAAGAIWHGQR